MRNARLHGDSAITLSIFIAFQNGFEKAQLPSRQPRVGVPEVWKLRGPPRSCARSYPCARDEMEWKRKKKKKQREKEKNIKRVVVQYFLFRFVDVVMCVSSNCVSCSRAFFFFFLFFFPLPAARTTQKKG